MFSATVEDKSFSVARLGEHLSVDDQRVEWTINSAGERDYYLIWNHKRYHVEVISVVSPKLILLNVNGKRCEVSLKDKTDLLLERMGLNINSAAKVNNIKAPMPGLILDIRVQVGTVVAEGDTLLVLEAMKMENIIKASAEGTVKALRITKGDSVEKGQVLIEF